MEKLLVSVYPLYIYLDPIENAIPFSTVEANVILHPALTKEGELWFQNCFCAVRAEGKIGWVYKDNIAELTEKMSRSDFIWEKIP